MTEPVRLSKRVTTLLGCSRQEAEQYIMGGWVLVDGEVIDEPQHKVDQQHVELDPEATLAPSEPATLLFHKPASLDVGTDGRGVVDGITPATRWELDPTGLRTLRRNLLRLTQVMPLEPAASGLQVFTQDPRLLRRMREEATRTEQELIVEVEGEMAPYGLRRLEHGLAYQGRNLPPMKASWQSENRLRFAVKDLRQGQVESMCRDVGVQVLGIRRIRIGRIPLAKMPVGQWRYLPAAERF